MAFFNDSRTLFGWRSAKSHRLLNRGCICIGITQELDYFVDLGVKIVWINPIFKSPMDDIGYDVENYTIIDPIFGTMDDFKELISEMNKRGKTVVVFINLC